MKLKVYQIEGGRLELPEVRFFTVQDGNWSQLPHLRRKKLLSYYHFEDHPDSQPARQVVLSQEDLILCE